MPIQCLDLNEQKINISEESITKLKQKIRGKIILPSDDTYNAVRKIWNDMVDKKPAFIVQCLTTEDIVQSVRFAKEHQLIISVRGAGHNIAGRALKNDVLLIDLSLMREVLVSSDLKTVTISPGATLADVDRETQIHGLAIPMGINSTTGISGLTLGGGFGWLSRKYGMTIDSLISVELVTADGDLIKVDNQNHSDLFWALKGGSGNFGIVASFKFHLHKVGPEILAGPIIFKADDAKKVLKLYNAFCEKASDDITIWAVLRHAPPFPFLESTYHGKPVMILVFFYLGEMSQGKKHIEAIKKFATPLADATGPMPFVQFQQIFDPLLTPGFRNYWKTHNFKTIDDKLIDILYESLLMLPSAYTEIFLGQMGGATNRISKEATAYPHRDINFVMNVHTRWEKPSEDTLCIQWARDFYQKTSAFATGGAYINFLSEGDENLSAAFAENLQRLATIKTKYDPNNVFRANLNIAPRQ
jgi:FAD/FMN-containing dehydrogenase